MMTGLEGDLGEAQESASPVASIPATQGKADVDHLS